MQIPSDDERELIAKAREGDVEAYEELARRHQEVAFRAAFHILRNSDDAEDVIQEAFVKAFHALGRFDGRRSFRPWLFRIVTNEARNARKAAQRRATLPARHAEVWGWGQTEDPVGDGAIRSDRREKLLIALDSLKHQDRLVISLRFFLELSEQEMAEMLGCRRGTVKSRLNRSMNRLRRVIKESFPELEATYEV